MAKKVLAGIKYLLKKRKRDPQIFHSKKFQKLVNGAVRFLESSPEHSLPIEEKFGWSGVYCLYYEGDFELYDDFSFSDREPIYVGKAVPKGWRKSRIKNSSKTYPLFKRIGEHCKSIDFAQNLNLDHFRCKYVVLEPYLIPAVESELICRYQPLWNSLVCGFGNHHCGKNRYTQSKTYWDVLHPGRPWAANMCGSSPAVEEITEKIKEFKK